MSGDWNWGLLAPLAFALIEAVAIVTALRAIMTVRTSQGAIAWSVALVSFPLLSLPLYYLFGRNRFQGYVLARRAGDLRIHHLAQNLARDFPPQYLAALGTPGSAFHALERLARIPFTRGNRLALLVNGQATFDAIFDALETARDYVLVQFFIVRDDGLGRRLHAALTACAARGVRVYFLYDAIGSRELPQTYVDSLRERGVEMEAFNAGNDRRSRYQINFRNHRKVLVIDGHLAFIGGHNVGDEYLGQDPALSPWRDTHVSLEGPAVLAAQLTFIEDWHWVTGRVPTLAWQAEAASDHDQPVLIAPTGPADEQETGSLLFTQLIGMARRRLWIVSPYFVPDSSVMNALHLAVLRGVDVRLLVPQRPDHRLVHLAAQAYYADAVPAGIRIHRHSKGFLHQKVVLIDDEIAAVGTVNLDNRSLRLNFEVTVISACPRFAAEVEAMLEQDFAASTPLTPEMINARRLPARIACRVARLFSPVL